jgi:hypothetical protein
MQVYGADFSGARDPGGGIYFTMGRLSDSTLPVEEAQPCDDRLDLFAAIVESNASWGLDSSFAVPTPAYEPVELSDWQDLLTLASPLDGRRFSTYLAGALSNRFELTCQEQRP